MSLVIPPGFAQVGIQFRNDADPEPWYVTFGVDTSTTDANPGAIAQKCMEAWFEGFGPTMSPDTAITGCQVVVGQDGEEPVREFRAPDDELRGNANDARLPQNCALLVRKNTAKGGRRNRGRMFVPGVLAESAVSNTGVIGSNFIGAYQGYASAFFASLEGGVNNPPAIDMVLLHSDGISSVPDPTPVDSLSVDNVISTQRRRLR